MSLSHSEAVRLGNPYIGLEHLFLGILKDGGSCSIQLLSNLNVNIEIFRQKLEASVRVVNPAKVTSENLPLTKQAERVLKYTYIIAKEFRSDMVRSEHLMLAILHERNNIISCWPSFMKGTISSRKTLSLKVSTMKTSKRS